jgi:hypothetical protein
VHTVLRYTPALESPLAVIGTVTTRVICSPEYDAAIAMPAIISINKILVEFAISFSPSLTLAEYAQN